MSTSVRTRGGAPLTATGAAVLALAVLVTAVFVTVAPTATRARAESLRQEVVDPTRMPADEALKRWRDVAATFDAAGGKADSFYVAADAAATLNLYVRLHGWQGPEVPRLVTTLAATTNPSGGFGLAKEWDAFQDGTVNASATSYTATTAGHVGSVMLAGYQAGAVPADVVRRALDWVLDLPRAQGSACIPYSDSPHDLAQPCVWNVHFGAAAWAKRASAATGYRTEDVAALVRGSASLLATVRPDPRTGYLPYSSADSRPQDIGHQFWTASSIDELRGNRAATAAMVRGPLWRTQAKRFRDYNVASAMSGIALFDCRYATDRLVLRYAGSTAGGNPYAFKALAAQARQVAVRCFPGSSGPSTADGRVSASARTAPVVVQPNLG